ncbi:HNH/ENDO VII family nuclease [Polyangium jinanense]|uniref:LHH domain-containing protein n=1 Tax=Polyangium jinanense TaxID=2829994 RepID=A0A9X4AUE3_9BACT|nr:HNH/ENDO VII family nuclease [Polyangium jinanense]MDC3955883.1 hypothetical protein [Polyangium jinanense]MDC3983242.1 hypothetical protein [Polyangium jinanense]MDC3985178.1 hypothetical protein [Polyangium jinanense]
MARIFEAPNVVHVCVRPPNVPKDKRIWGLTPDGTPFFGVREVDRARGNGSPTYVFDLDAPAASARLLPIPYNTLECPARTPPKPRVAAATEKAKEAEEKKDEGKKAERPKPLSRPIARTPGQERCTAYREPGQTRRRSGTGAGACTRVLVKWRCAEQAVADKRPPAAEPCPGQGPEPAKPRELPASAAQAYEDWGLSRVEASALAEDRARECLQGLCHARHPNFVPKSKKKPAETNNGQSLSTGSGSGGGASSPQPAPKTTTVKTTTKPVSKPNGAAAGQAGSSGGKTAGSGGGTVVPEGRRIPNDELKTPPAKRGKAPTGSDGHPVELHHRGQKPDSPLDEMTRTEHRGKGNFSENHSNTGQEPSKIDRKAWKEQQRRYWTKEHDRGRFDGKKQ